MSFPGSDLEFDPQQLTDALSTLKRSLASCEDTGDNTDWMQGDQTGTKWGGEPGSTSFSSSYRTFLTQVHKAVDQWSKDTDTVVSRLRQAHEALRNASEEEAAAINALLVEEWNQQSTPAPSPANSGPGLGFGVPQPGATDTGPGLGFGVPSPGGQ